MIQVPQEMQDYIDNMSGAAWKELALVQYRLSTLRQGLTHRETMDAVNDLIMKTATKLLKPRE